jgi:hypothetical protein
MIWLSTFSPGNHLEYVRLYFPYIDIYCFRFGSDFSSPFEEISPDPKLGQEKRKLHNQDAACVMNEEFDHFKIKIFLNRSFFN